MALIVTVDDHEDVRTLVERSLQRGGHTVIAATDGAAGLGAVREHRPDLVLTDVDMPCMTGLELCQAINADPHLQHIPVMLVSGSIHPDDPRTDYVGAAAVISKPFVPKDLLHAVNAVLTDAGALRRNDAVAE